MCKKGIPGKQAVYERHRNVKWHGENQKLQVDCYFRV